MAWCQIVYLIQVLLFQGKKLTNKTPVSNHSQTVFSLEPRVNTRAQTQGTALGIREEKRTTRPVVTLLITQTKSAFCKATRIKVHVPRI